jgi:hypothetical protein
MPAAILLDTRPFRRVKPVSLDYVPSSRRRASAIFRETSRNSSICLPSPSILAAHAYSLEQEKLKVRTTQSTQYIQQSQRSPSVAPLSTDSATNLQNFKFSSSAPQGITTTTESDIPAPSPGAMETGFSVAAQVKKGSDQPPTTVTDIETSSPLKVTARQNLLTPSPAFPRRQTVDAVDVPFLYIHEKLRAWGQVYLVDSPSADAFINPISSRRLSMATIAESPSPGSPITTTICARVSPLDKDRKPILLRRHFDMADLRATIPSPTKVDSPGLPSLQLRRSERNRRASAQVLGSKPISKDKESIKLIVSRLGSVPTPMREFISNRHVVLY